MDSADSSGISGVTFAIGANPDHRSGINLTHVIKISIVGKALPMITEKLGIEKASLVLDGDLVSHPGMMHLAYCSLSAGSVR